EIIVEYKSRQKVKEMMVPEEVFIKIKTPRNTMFIQLKYEKAEIDEPQELIIVIPEKYEKCN
ncbi:MAG: DUF4292 domain-containing protein, partial [Flavobacteriales bacterium]|nr:DUF4292 domain-containing protein [Flavobacteriales bacterium]